MSAKVTFLFTDLEDSTRQWERHPDAMRAALLRHDAIMQAAIDDHAGTLVKHTGDGVCAAFADALHAASACIAAQRALQRERFDEVALRSRMAMYTGIAERHGSDYRGAVLNRAARLMAAAHGGQVLVSHSAREEIGGRLPPGMHVRDMGVRRLKDVVEPEQVFQLVAEGLPSDFPPLRTQDARRLDVPASTTEFIGRERELDDITHILRATGTRMLTLTGPGGTGKSRLAIEAARRLVDDYDDGAIFVPLASVGKTEMVMPTIAQALGVQEEAGRDIGQTVGEAVRSKNMLLVLDNFEQIVEAAPLVSMLLEAASRLHVLVTSRECLHVSGEREYAVAPLALPDLDRLPRLDALARVEAVSLFITRAQAVKSDLGLVAENASDIAYICCRLDGLPLAIELAAARVRILSPSHIRRALDDRLQFLTGGARNEPERHRTLRATIEWSHALLTPEEQALFRRLAVFSGGATLEAIEAVCRVDGGADVLPTLESLAAKSLVRQAGRDGEPRFAMLETVREYARERLQRSDDAGSVADRHADNFALLADELHRHRNDPAEIPWISRIERDHDNVRAALAHCVSTMGAARGLRMCKSLFAFWSARGYLVEGRRWCERMLSLAPATATDYDRVATTHALAVLAARQGDYEAARPLLAQSASQLRERGNLVGAANALNNLGNVLLHTGDLPGARVAYEESVALKREAGAPLGITLGNLANVLREEGNLAGARSLLEDAVEMERQRGDLGGLSTTLNILSGIVRLLGDIDGARMASEEALAIVRRLADKGRLAEVLAERGDIASAEHDLQFASICYTEALGVALETGDRRAVALALEAFARLAIATGKPLAAARSFAAAGRIRDELKMHYGANDGWTAADARALCGDDVAFDAAWRAGSSATVESAVEFALRASAP